MNGRRCYILKNARFYRVRCLCTRVCQRGSKSIEAPAFILYSEAQVGDYNAACFQDICQFDWNTVIPFIENNVDDSLPLHTRDYIVERKWLTSHFLFNNPPLTEHNALLNLGYHTLIKLYLKSHLNRILASRAIDRNTWDEKGLRFKDKMMQIFKTKTNNMKLVREDGRLLNKS